LVRRPEQRAFLVLDCRIEPDAGRAQREVPALLADAALAQVEDLLTGEERAYDGGPLLQRRGASGTSGPGVDFGVRHAVEDTGGLEVTISSDGITLAAHYATPNGSTPAPAVAICHGFPTGPRGAAASAATFPELADRIARECGWNALAFNGRGTGASGGDFSVAGWLADIRSAVTFLEGRDETRGVWLVGIAEGGTLAILATAADARVRGCAALAAPVSFREWTRDATRMLEFARRVGMIRTPDFPTSVQAWARGVANVDAVAAAPRIAPRPLFVLIGTSDNVVAMADVRALVDAAGASGELRLVGGAGHELRHDPRAIASLLGWLDRQVVEVA
jgi:putative redox protein